MDPRRRPGAGLGPVAAVSSFSSTVVDLPEYIVSNFMPSLQPVLQRYPFAFRIVGVVLALWYFGPVSRLQSLWTRFSSLLVSSVNVVSDEDLFQYIVTHLSETRTLRADTSLNAMSNVPREATTRMMMREPEESNRRAAAHNETPKLKVRPEKRCTCLSRGFSILSRLSASKLFLPTSIAFPFIC